MTESKFGPIGSIVDVRTYRRFLPDKKRREKLEERNQRSTNYNINLAKNAPKEDVNIQHDYFQMLDYMNNFLSFPSGRSMWVGGTSVTEKHPAGCFNCSALAINRVSAFTTIFELLMLGTGVGYRVFKSDIEKLPEVNLEGTLLEFDEYQPKLPADRIEDTYRQVIENENDDTTKIWRIYVGDSRQGWIDAIDYLLKAAFFEECLPKTIQFNVDSIRPMGERIYGFGGTASGPDALKGIIQDIYRVIQECPTPKLRSIDCMDIADCIAKGVVAGSSRRSALICLFEEGDDLCATAKRGLFTNPELAHKKYRIQSNNTECIGSGHLSQLKVFLEENPDASWTQINKFISQFKPSSEWLKSRFEVVRYEGEPGFNNFLVMTAKRWKAIREHRPECPVNEIWVRYCDVVTNP
jgi:adenosylcobalamin-dependent ribonucleoside-triphosphate reductase